MPRSSFVRLSLLSLAAVSVVVSSGAAPAAAAEPGPRVVYGGRLQDAQGRPIAGIYPLTFNFYRTEKGGRPTWSESHYVAVDNGVYAVELGGPKPLPKNIALDKVWLGVGVTGGAEIVREKFAAADVPAAPPSATSPAGGNGIDPAAPPVAGAPPSKSTQSYAELAGFAYEAERAKTADAIGGMTAADLKNLAKTTGTPAKPKIGANKRYSEPAGGTGGNAYTLQCPTGYVVTGIKGGAAAYVDSLSLICSPLE